MYKPAYMYHMSSHDRDSKPGPPSFRASGLPHGRLVTHFPNDHIDSVCDSLYLMPVSVGEVNKYRLSIDRLNSEGKFFLRFLV